MPKLRSSDLPSKNFPFPQLVSPNGVKNLRQRADYAYLAHLLRRDGVTESYDMRVEMEGVFLDATPVQPVSPNGMSQG